MPLESQVDAQIFGEIAKGRGGHALHDVELPPEARQAYEDLSLRAQDLIRSARSAVSGLPHIHFGFVRHAEVNAFATCTQGRYFIGVNTGLVFLLRMLIGRILADRALFAWVGNALEERTDLPRIKFYVPHADQMWASEELVSPRNELRRVYAHHITDRALMFFVGHEIAHISRGHVDYWQRERGASVYSERLDETMAEALLFERQCLEWDADTQSIMTSVNSLRDTQESAGFEGFSWGSGSRDSASLFRDWSVVIAIVFRMMGDRRVSDIDLRKAHPPLLSRWQLADAVGRWGIDLFWPAEEREAARSGIGEGLREAARAFAAIVENVLKDAPELPPAEHLVKLQNYWNDVLVGKVRPYSYEF